MSEAVSDAGFIGRRPHVLRRLAAHPSFSQYRRLAFAVWLVNLAIVAYAVADDRWWSDKGFDLAAISNLVLANISIAILVRQQYVINILFWLATRAPTSWPLSIRWALGKVYHFGGLHVGCAVAATIWFVVLVAAMTYHLALRLPSVSMTTVIVSWLLAATLVLMVAMAQPPIRMKHHNSFERAHRFGGWTALVLFWLQTMLFVDDQRGAASLGDALVASPAFWMLVVLSVSIALPWLRLRRVAIDLDRPSSHAAVLRFAHGATPFPGSSTAISRNPLVEWHSFANIPSPGEDGFRLIVSRAGDWTGAFIDDAPRHVWVKGITTAGVAYIETLFKRVVYVATGSGIGPVMPHLLARQVPIHLIWSTRNPRRTYGDALVDEILAAQPNALIWDTDEHGKPDLVKLAYQACQSFNAEAVICIANQKLTQQVVQEMEYRGIPAFGAIWDS